MNKAQKEEINEGKEKDEKGKRKSDIGEREVKKRTIIKAYSITKNKIKMVTKGRNKRIEKHMELDKNKEDKN